MTFLFGQPAIETRPLVEPIAVKKPLSNKEKEMLSKIIHGRYKSGFLKDMQADIEYQKYLKEEKNKK